jgi:hypothetical protein
MSSSRVDAITDDYFARLRRALAPHGPGELEPRPVGIEPDSIHGGNVPGTVPA